MFDPIFNIDQEQLLGIFFIVGLIVISAALTFTTVVNAKRYVMSEELTWFNPFFHFFIEHESDPVFRSLIDMLVTMITIAMFPFVFAVMLLLLNWCWLPLVIIGGIFAGLKGARSLVSLTRVLNEHESDKNVHK